MRPTLAQATITTDTIEPGAEVASWVDYFWWVRWNLAEPHVQEVIPRPVVQVAAEEVDGEARLVVTGVHPNLFQRQLAGAGRTIGIAFRPAAFWGLFQGDVSTLQGRELLAEELFEVDDRAVARAVLASEDAQRGAELLRDWVLDRRPVMDELTLRLAGLVEQVEQDAAIVRAEQLAKIAGVGLRTLQRWFRQRVGIGPKWVVQRCRLLDVMAVAHTQALAREAVAWADLALRLGYTDQSHLIRAFTRLIGQPPAAYVRQA